MRKHEADALTISARDAFRLYLRTGRRVPAHRIVQFKFNPNHDPKTGRFTFKNGSSGSGGTASRQRGEGGRESSGGAGLGDGGTPGVGTYTVKTGDTLTHIAATRVGLTVQDLAAINGISPDVIIQPGQKLVLPTQAYLDRAKQGFDAANALALYAQNHGGQLPPNVAHPPSVAEQMSGPGAHTVTDHGYQFTIDGEGRTRIVSGAITLNPDQGRSKENQLAAGGSDRLPSDQGGHYIAREFNGPTEAYNHFAQDANFNQSGYRKLENLWGATTRRGEKVHVTIGAEYEDGSRRPYEIDVDYTIAGVTERKEFPNRSEK